MASEYFNKRADEIDKKMKQLKAQKQQLMAKIKESERKERTHRLIQIGAIMDNMGIKTTAQADALLKAFQNNPEFKEILDKIIGT